MRLRKVHLMEIMTTLIGMSTVVAKDIIEVQFDPPPKLECSIVPVNGRVIRLDIVNTNDTTPVNILKWNSILEDFPVARVPFYLRTAQDGRDIDRSPSAHATYVNVLDTHFIQISPLNPYQLEIDLSRWFAIPTRENYTVRWNGNLKGFLGNHGSQPATEKGLKRSDLYTMPGLDCFAEAEVELDSSVMPSQVGETAECSLWQYRGDRVRDARNGAIDLAKKTKTNALRKKIFWRRYFNGNAAVEADVSRVFSNIEEYPNPRGGNSFLLTERCAINDRAPCGPGVVSYHIREEKTKIRSTIVFCPLGLGNALARPQEIDGIVEAKQECDFPGPGRIPQSNRDMMDLTGVYLNAFLRSGIPRAGAEDIEDGMYLHPVQSNIVLC
ncbi:MAG: hypothetical protein M1812_004273 [Candelaria pacifica]|nr:MAG: hypothetical protein M1812_004273 [Candelaria pacifica]